MSTSTTLGQPEAGTATRRVSAPKESIPAEAFIRAMRYYVLSNQLEDGQKFLDILNQSLATEDNWPKIARELQAILSEAWERRNARLAGPRDVTRNTFLFGERGQYVENSKIDDTQWSAG